MIFCITSARYDSRSAKVDALTVGVAPSDGGGAVGLVTRFDLRLLPFCGAGSVVGSEPEAGARSPNVTSGVRGPSRCFTFGSSGVDAGDIAPALADSTGPAALLPPAVVFSNMPVDCVGACDSGASVAGLPSVAVSSLGPFAVTVMSVEGTSRRSARSSGTVGGSAVAGSFRAGGGVSASRRCPESIMGEDFGLTRSSRAFSSSAGRAASGRSLSGVFVTVDAAGGLAWACCAASIRGDGSGGAFSGGVPAERSGVFTGEVVTGADLAPTVFKFSSASLVRAGI